LLNCSAAIESESELKMMVFTVKRHLRLASLSLSSVQIFFFIS
jgi:hypothetical protein